MLQISFGVNDSIKKKPFIRISFKENVVFVNCRLVGSGSDEPQTFPSRNYRTTDYETKIKSVSGNIHELKLDFIDMPNMKISVGLFYSVYKFQSGPAFYNEFTEVSYGHGPKGNFVVDSTKSYYDGTDQYRDNLDIRGTGLSLGFGFHKTIHRWYFDGDIMFMAMPRSKGKLKREYISTFGPTTCDRYTEFEFDSKSIFGALYNVGISYQLYRFLWMSGGFKYNVIFSDVKEGQYYNYEGFSFQIKNFNQFGINLGLTLAF
jgi:hypothetical protein